MVFETGIGIGWAFAVVGLGFVASLIGTFVRTEGHASRGWFVDDNTTGLFRRDSRYSRTRRRRREPQTPEEEAAQEEHDLAVAEVQAQEQVEERAVLNEEARERNELDLLEEVHEKWSVAVEQLHVVTKNEGFKEANAHEDFIKAFVRFESKVRDVFDELHDEEAQAKYQYKVFEDLKAKIPEGNNQITQELDRLEKEQRQLAAIFEEVKTSIEMIYEETEGSHFTEIVRQIADDIHGFPFNWNQPIQGHRTLGEYLRTLADILRDIGEGDGPLPQAITLQKKLIKATVKLEKDLHKLEKDIEAVASQ